MSNDAAEKSPAGRRALSLTFSIFLAVVCFLLATSAAGTHSSTDSAPGSPPAVQLLSYLGWGFATSAAVMLIWRKRWPFWITGLTIVVTLVFPTTALTLLILISVLIHLRRGRWVWIFTGAAYAAVVACIIWDAHSEDRSMLASFALDADGERVPGIPFDGQLWWLAPLLALVVMVPSVGIGLLRRSRTELGEARGEARLAEREAAVAHSEMARERERQEVAREIHDTLASRLSALSLHAGALELSVEDENSPAAQAARVVRSSAQHSLDDLRHVIDVLRNPRAAETVAGNTIRDLAPLIDEAVAAGERVRSSIFVSDAMGCDPVVAHTTYRLTQESLSNARRHAPGTDVHVNIQGGPGAGVTIRVVNTIVRDGQPTSRGGGHGLDGMRERVRLVGGTFAAELAAGGTHFVVTAWLPWVAPVLAEGATGYPR